MSPCFCALRIQSTLDYVGESSSELRMKNQCDNIIKKAFSSPVFLLGFLDRVPVSSEDRSWNCSLSLGLAMLVEFHALTEHALDLNTIGNSETVDLTR